MQKRRVVGVAGVVGVADSSPDVSSIPPTRSDLHAGPALESIVAVVRDNEPIIIPLSEVKSRYPNFDANDFSVNLMASNWNRRTTTRSSRPIRRR